MFDILWQQDNGKENEIILLNEARDYLLCIRNNYLNSELTFKNISLNELNNLVLDGRR